MGLLQLDVSVLNLCQSGVHAAWALTHHWVLSVSLLLGVVGARVLGPLVEVITLTEDWSKVAIVLLGIVDSHGVLSGNNVQLPRNVAVEILEASAVHLIHEGGMRFGEAFEILLSEKLVSLGGGEEVVLKSEVEACHGLADLTPEGLERVVLLLVHDIFTLHVHLVFTNRRVE